MLSSGQCQLSPSAGALAAACVTDITYIRTMQGFAYLAVVLDLDCRRVAG